MLSQPEHCGDEATGHLWYENDLQLAAELGKALLERNMDLESQLHILQQTMASQESEIVLLRRQLDALRAIDESRARACEEIDRTAHELEKANTRLLHDRRTDAESMKSLTETVSQLEQRCELLESAVSAERSRANERERGRRREARRARSVPGRDSATSSSGDFRGLPSRSPGNDVVAAGLRLRLEVQKGRCHRAESELAAALTENQELRSQVQELVAAAVAKNKTEELQPTVKHAPVPVDVICAECHKKMGPPPFAEPFEHDLDELPSGTGNFVRLKNGGSAFGSRDSLYRIGLEPDDTTPGREVCSAILAAGFQTTASPEEEVQPSGGSTGGGSLLAELEEQYRKLVVRYEALIEAKSANAAKTEPNGSSGRPRDLPLPTPDPTEGHFDNGPPEYKRLFREIFETLRRSAEYPFPPSETPK